MGRCSHAEAKKRQRPGVHTPSGIPTQSLLPLGQAAPGFAPPMHKAAVQVPLGVPVQLASPAGQANPSLLWSARGPGYSIGFTRDATLLRVGERTVAMRFPGQDNAASHQLILYRDVLAPPAGLDVRKPSRPTACAVSTKICRPAKVVDAAQSRPDLSSDAALSPELFHCHTAFHNYFMKPQIFDTLASSGFKQLRDRHPPFMRLVCISLALRFLCAGRGGRARYLPGARSQVPRSVCLSRRAHLLKG